MQKKGRLAQLQQAEWLASSCICWQHLLPTNAGKYEQWVRIPDQIQIAIFDISPFDNNFAH